MPIDPDFKQSRQILEKHYTHDVYGPVKPTEVLGIHGSVVAVDFDICIADGVCIDVCPVSVFSLHGGENNGQSQTHTYLNNPEVYVPKDANGNLIELEKYNAHTPNESGMALLALWKADPTREADCIFCMACEVQCPVQAIKIYQS